MNQRQKKKIAFNIANDEYLYRKIKRTLEENELAREDDYALFGGVLALCDPYHLPSLESITRARRKLQEQYPELRSNAKARKD